MKIQISLPRLNDEIILKEDAPMPLIYLVEMLLEAFSSVVIFITISLTFSHLSRNIPALLIHVLLKKINEF